MRTSFFLFGWVLLFPFFSEIASAIPLESAFPNSGKYAAIGAAAVSVAEGPDSLLLNPAGLPGENGFQWTINAAPSFVQREAPLVLPNQGLTSKFSFFPVIDVIGSHALSPSLSFGAGITAVGGVGADYGHVDFGDYPVNPEVKTLVSTSEAVLGVGYQLSPEWSIGAVWRVTVFLPSETHSVQVLPSGSLQILDVTNLTGSDFTGLRVGVKYREKEGKWGLGVSLRNSVDWKLTGSGSSTIVTSTSAGSHAPLGNVSLKAVLPLKLAVGWDFQVSPSLSMFTEYDFYKYSENKTRDITIGSVTTPITTAWSDAHLVHLGLQYGDRNHWPIRLGYTFETQVIPGDHPEAITVAPAIHHGFSVGSETSFGNTHRLSGAFIYQFASGHGTPAVDSTALSGDYRSRLITAAVSLNW